MYIHTHIEWLEYGLNIALWLDYVINKIFNIEWLVWK